jgi:hypothetical protein
MDKKPILCVDFDGVISDYSSGWKGADVIPDPPVLGAIAWLWKATKYWDVCIYSSRSSQEDGIDAMREWLRHYAFLEFGSRDAADMLIAALAFPTQKPAAFLTIDDRAVCFHGNFDTIDPEELLNFKPWNRREAGSGGLISGKMTGDPGAIRSGHPEGESK